MYGLKRTVIRTVVWSLVLLVIAAPSIAVLTGVAPKTFWITVPGQVVVLLSLIYVTEGWRKLMAAPDRSIPDPTRAGEAYSSIASIQARSGDADSAFSWASRLDAPVAKAFALIGITAGLAARKAEKRSEHR